MSSTEKFLSDYTTPTHSILSCDLIFTIGDTVTTVKNTIQVQQIDLRVDSIVLNGINLELIEVVLDGHIILPSEYQIDLESLTIFRIPNICTISITTRIFPEQNTALEWLFKSGDIFCTQNEPEWFRKITYFPDRPDVMTIFTTTIIAPKKYPILLSNGNLIDSGDIDADTHFTKWNDPFKKPSYLFALVVWDFGKISDTYTTTSGNIVDLHIFSEHGNEKKCLHAMQSLKKSMKWDEDTYGREYDLDVFHIVAVDSFNMWAMENKSLNIFNTVYVLADIETATDRDFLGVESVIAHEYFHNWTGNRVTCRDWFQLTLKEGLTVFRDHDFSWDMNSRHTMRIEDIRDLREFQFSEDAGPTAHPIKPASYKEINNFYTATVYEKGSEVIRMMATLLGKEKFRKAMDLYFETFDGQAVTTEDFVWAMETGGEMDLTQFEETWYHQERTPELIVTGTFNASERTYRIDTTQITLKNTHAIAQKPFFYPLTLALFDATGKQYPLDLLDTTGQDRLPEGILIISKDQESFIFKNIITHPKVSLNRGFSAPITITFDESDPMFLIQHETDGFARYEAIQQYTTRVIFESIDWLWIPGIYLSVFGSTLVDSSDRLFQSLLLQIPTLSTLSREYPKPIDFDILSDARNTLIECILQAHEDRIIELYTALRSSLPNVEGITSFEIGTRAYMTRLLDLLSYSKNTKIIIILAEEQYNASHTMTLRLASLSLLSHFSRGARHPRIQEFIDSYGDNPLVIMKYLSMIAQSKYDTVVQDISRTKDEGFYRHDLPNHARALFGTFSKNLEFFHKKDGSGYALICDFIIKSDPSNPHTAARIAGAFSLFPKLNIASQDIMRPYLEKILSQEWLSKNTEEIIDKILHYK